MEITIHPNLTMYKYHDGNGALPVGWTAERALEQLTRRLPDTPVRLLSEEEAERGDLGAVRQLLAGRVDRAMLERMPGLEWVQFPGSGKDHFFAGSGLTETDFAARGVEVVNSPGVNSNAVAEHAVAMMLALSRGVPRAVRQQLEHRWEIFSAIEMRGKTIAIIGLGAVGESVARLARAFGMSVLATKNKPENHDGNAHVVRPSGANAEVVAAADFVVLCAPHTGATASMFDRAMFRIMRPSAFFVNVSRGANVVAADLHEALVDGVIAGAAIDTFGSAAATEAKRLEALDESSPLWDCPNLLVMPNNASSNDRYMDYFAQCVAEQYLARRAAGR